MSHCPHWRVNRFVRPAYRTANMLFSSTEMWKGCTDNVRRRCRLHGDVGTARASLWSNNALHEFHNFVVLCNRGFENLPCLCVLDDCGQASALVDSSLGCRQQEITQVIWWLWAVKKVTERTDCVWILTVQFPRCLCTAYEKYPLSLLLDGLEQCSEAFLACTDDDCVNLQGWS